MAYLSAYTFRFWLSKHTFLWGPMVKKISNLTVLQPTAPEGTSLSPTSTQSTILSPPIAPFKPVLKPHNSATTLIDLTSPSGFQPSTAMLTLEHHTWYVVVTTTAPNSSGHRLTPSCNRLVPFLACRSCSQLKPFSTLSRDILPQLLWFSGQMFLLANQER